MPVSAQHPQPMAPTHSTGTVWGWSSEWGPGHDWAETRLCLLVLSCCLAHLGMCSTFRGVLAWLLEAAEELRRDGVFWGMVPCQTVQTVSYYSHSSLYQNLKDILPTAGLLFAFCTTVVVAVDALHTECGHYVSLNLMWVILRDVLAEHLLLSAAFWFWAALWY